MGALSEFEFDDPDDLTLEQRDAITLWGSDVWEYCTGVWPLPRHAGAKGSLEPRPIIWTQDKLRREERPFPRDNYIRRAILYPIFNAPKLGPDGRPFRLRMAGWKPRQVFWTNAALIGMKWDVEFNRATEWLVAKNKKPEAQRFIANRVRFTHSKMPEWYRRWAAVPPKPRGEFRPSRTSSAILPVARNFGESGEAIGETASVFIDEPIRLRGLRSAWLAADAQAPRIIAPSAPPERGVRVDPESLAFFREMVEDLPDGSLTRLVVGLDDLSNDDADDVDDDGDEPEVAAWAS